MIFGEIQRPALMCYSTRLAPTCSRMDGMSPQCMNSHEASTYTCALLHRSRLQLDQDKEGKWKKRTYVNLSGIKL